MIPFVIVLMTGNEAVGLHNLADPLTSVGAMRVSGLNNPAHRSLICLPP